MSTTPLVFSSDGKTWKRLVDGLIEAIGLPGLIKKSHITAIVIETRKGPIRFAPDAKGKKP